MRVRMRERMRQIERTRQRHTNCVITTHIGNENSLKEALRGNTMYFSGFSEGIYKCLFLIDVMSI